MILLSIAAILSLSIGLYRDFSSSHDANEPRVGWVEGTAIIFAIMVVALTNAWNDFDKERKFRKVEEGVGEGEIKILKNKKTCPIPPSSLVVGDILLLAPGDILPCDVLIGSGSLFIDESLATGELNPVWRNESDVGISGGKVVEGEAKGIVIAVGKWSLSGRIMMDVQNQERNNDQEDDEDHDDENRDDSNSDDEQGKRSHYDARPHRPRRRRDQDRKEVQTPLEMKLTIFADKIAKFGVIAASLMMM